MIKYKYRDFKNCKYRYKYMFLDVFKYKYVFVPNPDLLNEFFNLKISHEYNSCF